MNARQRRRRIAFLSARLDRDIERLEVVQDGERLRGPLVSLARAVAGATDDTSFEAIVDLLVDKLDAMIEPRNPVLEWASDVGIEIAAWVAVSLWLGTEKRIERRIERTKAKIKALRGR